MLMFGEKPSSNCTYVNDWVVTTTARSAKLQVGRHNAIMIPHECVRVASYRGKNYNVVQSVGFLKMQVNGVIRTLVGCFGYCEMYTQGIFVAVGPDDPMLVGVPYSIIHVRDAFSGEEESDAHYPGYAPPSVLAEGNEIGAQLTVLVRERQEAEKSGDDEATKTFDARMDELWGKLDSIVDANAKMAGRMSEIEASAALKDVNPPPPEQKRVKFGSFQEKPSPSEERERYKQEALALMKEVIDKATPKSEITTKDGVTTVHIMITAKQEKKEDKPVMKPIKVHSVKYAE